MPITILEIMIAKGFLREETANSKTVQGLIFQSMVTSPLLTRSLLFRDHWVFTATIYGPIIRNCSGSNKLRNNYRRRMNDEVRKCSIADEFNDGQLFHNFSSGRELDFKPMPRCRLSYAKQLKVSFYD